MMRAIAVLAVLVVGCDSPATPAVPDVSGEYSYEGWDNDQPRYQITGDVTLSVDRDGTLGGTAYLVRSSGAGMDITEGAVVGTVEDSTLSLSSPWRHTATVRGDSICGTVTIPESGYKVWQGEFCLRRR